MPKLTAAQIAQMVGGELRGPGETVIAGVASVDKANRGDLSFIRDAKLTKLAAASRAGAIISPCCIEGYEGSLIICDDAELAFCRVLERFAEERFPRPEGVSPHAFVSSRATLGAGASVGHFAVIEDDVTLGSGAVVYPLVYVGRGARIGDRTVLYPHVSVREGVEVGADCIIHCNTAIGDDGFGYIQREGRHVKLPQVGGVRIGNGVEISGFVTVQRAMLDETVVEDGVKIDSHSHLAHSTCVGEHSLLVAYAKLAGSVKLGKGVLVMGDVSITDHVTVGDGAVLAAGSGVHRDVKPGQVVWGYPAREHGLQRRIWAVQGKLPEMHRRLKELEEQVASLREQLRKGRRQR